MTTVAAQGTKASTSGARLCPLVHEQLLRNIVDAHEQLRRRIRTWSLHTSECTLGVTKRTFAKTLGNLGAGVNSVPCTSSVVEGPASVFKWLPEPLSLVLIGRKQTIRTSHIHICLSIWDSLQGMRHSNSAGRQRAQKRIVFLGSIPGQLWRMWCWRGL